MTLSCANVTKVLATSWSHSLAKRCDERERAFHLVLVSSQCQLQKSGPLLDLQRSMGAADQELFSFAADVCGRDSNEALRKFVKPSSRVLFLRHAPLSAATGGCTCRQEGNCLFSPLHASGVDFENHAHPHIIVDKPRAFGSCPDEARAMNHQGAELPLNSARVSHSRIALLWDC